MFFKPKRKDIDMHDSRELMELQNFIEPSGVRYLNKPAQKEMSLFSKKNYTFNYTDSRRITVIKDSIIFLKI